MAEIEQPQSLEEIAALITAATEAGSPVELRGRGSMATLGRPMQCAKTLDLSALSGITLYEPEELVLAARAGTSMAEIEAAVAEKNQMLAFEPADWGALLGGASGAGSLGGAIACNLAGPRRIKAGAARDHFLGFTAVSGRGEIFKAGGRVMKNVSGYDMMKLLAGSYGTLAAMTDITIKVLPRPEKTYTVLLYGLDDASGCEALRRGLGSSHEVSSAAHLPAEIAAGSAVAYVANAGRSVTALRIEGPGPSVLHRTAALRQGLADLGESEELHSMNSQAFWHELRDVTAFQQQPDAIVWRVSVPPTDGPATTAGLKETLPGLRYFYDWGGGLIWLALDSAAATDGGAAAIRQAIASCGGHATLIRGPLGLRAACAVFQPQPDGLAALSKRIKQGFDPLGILNPGRMVEGI